MIPNTPRPFDFNLEFIPSDGEWKLIAINVKIDEPK